MSVIAIKVNEDGIREVLIKGAPHAANKIDLIDPAKKPRTHGLVSLVALAYNNHYDIVLRPMISGPRSCRSLL